MRTRTFTPEFSVPLPAVEVPCEVIRAGVDGQLSEVQISCIALSASRTSVLIDEGLFTQDKKSFRCKALVLDDIALLSVVCMEGAREPLPATMYELADQITEIRITGVLTRDFKVI